MDAYDFQKLVADLLKAIGYHVSWIAPPGKDGGVDILAYTDALGTQGPRIKVQCQCALQRDPPCARKSDPPLGVMCKDTKWGFNEGGKRGVA